MKVHPQTAGYRALILCFGMIIELTPCPMPRKTVNPIILSDTLAQTFNNRSSALTGAAITVLAFAEPFIAAGVAVAFWSFFATEKGLGPRGYERNEIMNTWWVPPSIREISYLMKIRFLPLANII
jgi:hypothetical protein